MIEKLYSKLKEHGFKGQVLSIQHLDDLRNDIEKRHTQGDFDEEFYQEALSFFSFRPPSDFPNATFLIVVAIPRPQTKVNFTWNEKTLTLTLPPIYTNFREIPRQVGKILTKVLAPEGYSVAPARLPHKLLAVRSGLAKYGRNNISYIPGMGSFFQLATFYSDLPCQKDTWLEPCMLDRCQNCKICLTKCPTGAITSEQFMIRAERCLTFHNERPSTYPFPSWVKQSDHNSLVGCMLCQQYCPENEKFLECVESNIEFSHEETSMFLKGSLYEQLPATTIKKIEKLGLVEYFETLSRNLAVFFDRKKINDQ